MSRRDQFGSVERDLRNRLGRARLLNGKRIEAARTSGSAAPRTVLPAFTPAYRCHGDAEHILNHVLVPTIFIPAKRKRIGTDTKTPCEENVYIKEYTGHNIADDRYRAEMRHLLEDGGVPLSEVEYSAEGFDGMGKPIGNFLGNWLTTLSQEPPDDFSVLKDSYLKVILSSDQFEKLRTFYKGEVDRESTRRRMEYAARHATLPGGDTPPVGRS